MTLREPSFLAALTSASMPPRSAAEVAVAASAPDPPDPFSLAGGAQAASAATPTAATSETRRALLAMKDLHMRRQVGSERASPSPDVARCTRPSLRNVTQLSVTGEYRDTKFCVPVR
jgi:hypothetical protein